MHLLTSVISAAEADDINSHLGRRHCEALKLMVAHNPIEIHALFQDAFNRGDVQALTSLYEPGAILMVNGTQVTGRESIGAAFEAMVSAGTSINLVTRSIIESGDGVALLHCEWTVHRPATTEQPETRGVSAEVLRKQSDGTWLFIIDNPYTPTHEQRRS